MDWNSLGDSNSITIVVLCAVVRLVFGRAFKWGGERADKIGAFFAAHLGKEFELRHVRKIHEINRLKKEAEVKPPPVVEEAPPVVVKEEPKHKRATR